MTKKHTLLASLAMIVAIFATLPTYAVSDQYKEEAVQQVHQPQAAPAVSAEREAIIAAPAATKPARTITSAREAAAPAAQMQRRRMDPPVLMMVVGGALLLLAIVFTIVAIVSVSFGAGILVALFWTLGWLAVIGGLIWFLVTR